MQTYTPGFSPSYTPMAANPKSYICTGKALALAILKLLEGLAAVGAAVLLILAMDGLPRSFYDAEGIIWLFLIFSMLGLAAADGLGGFFLRVARKGATAVQAAHVARAVVSMIRFIAWCGVITMLIWSLALLIGTEGGRVILGYVPFYLWIILAFAVTLIFLMRLSAFGYHRGIAQIMSHTRKELAQGAIMRPSFWSRLPGLCVRLITYNTVIVAIELILYAISRSEALQELVAKLSGPASSYQGTLSWSAFQDLNNVMSRINELLEGFGDMLRIFDKPVQLFGRAAFKVFKEVPWEHVGTVLDFEFSDILLVIAPTLYAIVKTVLVLFCAKDFNATHA